MSYECFIGIDVSQDWLDVHLRPEEHLRRFDNTEAGYAQLISWLATYPSGRIVCEATGGLEKRMVRALSKADMRVHVVNPSRISAFRGATGKLAKTDTLDAEIIAFFAEKFPEDAPEPLSEEQERLKALAARRRQLVQMQTQERNRLKRAENAQAKASIQAVLQLLQDEREAIEQALEEAIEQDEAQARRYEILQSIPGIGPAVAMTLLSEMPELGALDDKQVASLAGLAPHPRQSGKAKGSSSVRGGRKCVRAALYMAAMAAKRSNPPIIAFFNRMVEKGKPKMVALTAAMRKLLIQANALLRDNRLWQNLLKENH